MPVYSIKEFAKLCKMEPKQIHTQISRGNLVKNEFRQIDTSNQTNEAFLIRKQSLNEETVEEVVIEEKPKGKIKKKNNEINYEAGEPEPDQPEKKQNPIVELDLEERKLRIEKLRRENEIKEEELKKKRGEVIDLQKTLTFINTYSSNLKKDFAQSMQIFIQDICARYGIEPEKAGELKLKVIDLLNQSNKSSISSLEDLV